MNVKPVLKYFFPPFWRGKKKKKSVQQLAREKSSRFSKIWPLCVGTDGSPLLFLAPCSPPGLVGEAAAHYNCKLPGKFINKALLEPGI